MHRRLVPDADLRVELLPELSDADAIFRFAMLFDGCEHFGSLERAVEAAAAGRRDTLVDLRNELFISCRRSRHQDSDEFVATYGELYPLFKSLILDTKQ